MPKLVYGMTQTTEQEESDVQRVMEASIAQEMDERAQKELEMAQFTHAIEETSATAAIAAEQDRNDDAMIKILIGLKLKIRPVDNDGNCFFHAVAMDLKTSKKDDGGATSRLFDEAKPDHAMLRGRTIDWMKTNLSLWGEADPNPEARIIQMSHDKVFADHIELVAMSSLLRRQIHVYSWEWYNADPRKPYNTIDPLPPVDQFKEMLSILNTRPIRLFHRKENHYDLLMDVSDPKPKRTYSVPQTENCICLMKYSDVNQPYGGFDASTYPTSLCFTHWPALMFDNSQAYLESLPSKEREVRAKEIAAQDDDKEEQPKLYGTLFPDDSCEEARPFTLNTNGEALHEVLNADTDDMVPITHIDAFISSANKMILNRSMVGDDIVKHAENFLSAVDRAKNFAQRDSELQVDVFKGSSKTPEGESIPPSGTEAENVDEKEGWRMEVAIRTQVMSRTKAKKNPPSKTKQRVHLSFLHPEDYENTPSETKQRAIVFANAAVHQNFAADYMPPVFPAVVGRNYFLHPEDPAAFQYTGVWVTATNPAVVGRTYYNHYSAPRDEVTENGDEKEEEENGGGNTDPIDVSNKGGNENPPSKKKEDITYDNSEGGKEDDNGEKNHDNSVEGTEAERGKSDKNNERHNIESSEGINGLGTECAAADRCPMKGAPFAKPYHKCMNCCNLMHGGVCGVLWSEKGVEGSHISRGKYAPLPYIFYSHVCFFVSK